MPDDSLLDGKIPGRARFAALGGGFRRGKSL